MAVIYESYPDSRNFNCITYIYAQDLIDKSARVDERQFKKHVMQSLKTLFGVVGSSINIDVLKYSSSDRRAFIRCPSDYFIKLHCALTLTGSFRGKACAYRFHNISPTLISLASNSRAYKHS